MVRKRGQPWEREGLGERVSESLSENEAAAESKCMLLFGFVGGGIGDCLEGEGERASVVV